ncbi:hypothetical protein LNM86_04435 [Bartonella machadoae]|nr:hypothetical protein LNM86_04230 [Bartonella machadoae]UNE55086.1 hypothetical protein LNM86_04435 [Bartonella machadoae]
MKLIRRVMVMCAVIFLVGCAAKRIESCGGWLPIYLDQQDVGVISANLARDILKHNKHGAHLCGWKDEQKSQERRAKVYRERTGAPS